MAKIITRTFYINVSDTGSDSTIQYMTKIKDAILAESTNTVSMREFVENHGDMLETLFIPIKHADTYVKYETIDLGNNEPKSNSLNINKLKEWEERMSNLPLKNVKKDSEKQSAESNNVVPELLEVANDQIQARWAKLVTEPSQLKRTRC